jgi:hypothetical protein
MRSFEYRIPIMFRASQGIVDRNPGMLFLDHPGQSFIKAQVSRKREYAWTRNHDFADADVFQFQRAVDHLLLKLGNLPELPAGCDDQLEFIRGVHGPLMDFARSENTQYASCRPAH